MRKRTNEEQSAFRESLFQEHYNVFQRHRIFCHACLSGFWDRRIDPAQKVDAHHIAPYARVYNEAWVHSTANGILLAPFFHDEIHKEYWRRNQRDDVEIITREFVGRNFNRRWQEMKGIYLPDGQNFVDVWEAHLVSKGLLTSHTEVYLPMSAEVV